MNDRNISLKTGYVTKFFSYFCRLKTMELNNFDIQKIREQFPTLNQMVYGKRLVYFDNAATTQKPISVIDRERDYYLNENCNIHRGVHYLSQMATEAYEEARKTVATFVNARQPEEIIFTRGTTESLNLLATDRKSVV